MKSQIIDIANYLYKKTNQSINLKDKCWNDLIDSFIEILDKENLIHSIGRNYLRDYFIFQFQYWIEKKTRFESTIMPNWILGKKSFERWEDRNEHWSYFNQQFIDKYNIVFNREFVKVDCEDIEEEERKRFLNKEEGLAHCIEFASYNRMSSSCMICKFKRSCKEYFEKCCEYR